jgi:DNA-binding LytR/AlgR family response regulator
MGTGANAESIERYLLATGAALWLLMVVLQPDVGFSAPRLSMALFWALQIGVGLVVLQSLLYLMARWRGIGRLPTWSLVLGSGVLGSALLAPLYWLIGEGLMQQMLGMPATAVDEEQVAAGVVAVLRQEYFDIVGPVTASWLVICLPRLHWLVPPRLAGAAASPNASDAPSILPGVAPSPMAPAAATWRQRLPDALGDDLIAVASELQYLRVWTTQGSALVLGALNEVEADTALEGLRVHRSWWVRARHVRSVRRTATGVVCVMSDGRTVPVSRRRKADVLARFGDGATYARAVSEPVSQTDLR